MSNNQRSLVRKLSEIMKAVGYVQKKGYNADQKYTFMQEADLLEAVREHFAEKNIMIFPRILSKDVLEAGQTAKGAKKWLTTIEMEFTIEDGDSGEQRIITSGGQGIDMGDKGIYKAITGCNKYAIVKLLQIPTGDDPEQDGGVHPDQWAGNQNNKQERPQHPPQQRGQAQGRSQERKQPQSQQSGQKNDKQRTPSYKEIKKKIDLLGWNDNQMMQYINGLRQKNGQPAVSRFVDLTPDWKIAVSKALDKKVSQSINADYEEHMSGDRY